MSVVTRYSDLTWNRASTLSVSRSFNRSVANFRKVFLYLLLCRIDWMQWCLRSEAMNEDVSSIVTYVNSQSARSSYRLHDSRPTTADALPLPWYFRNLAILSSRYRQTVIGCAIVYAVYALAYTLLNLYMLGIHKFRPSQINFSSTKSLSMITTVMQLCSG